MSDFLEHLVARNLEPLGGSAVPALQPRPLSLFEPPAPEAGPVVAGWGVTPDPSPITHAPAERVAPPPEDPHPRPLSQGRGEKNRELASLPPLPVEGGAMGEGGRGGEVGRGKASATSALAPALTPASPITYAPDERMALPPKDPHPRPLSQGRGEKGRELASLPPLPVEGGAMGEGGRGGEVGRGKASATPTLLPIQPAVPAHSAPPRPGPRPEPLAVLQPRIEVPVPFPSGRPAAAEPAPVIHVTIGRVEVRAAPAPSPALARRPSAPAVPTLDEYLRRRDRRDR